IVRPRGVGNPSTTRRNGSPPQCASIVRTCTLLVGIGQPLLKIVGGLNRDEAAHAEMAQATELRARDLVLTEAGGDEPDWNLHAWDGVLLHPHLIEAEAVYDVLARQVHEHRSSKDVIHSFGLNEMRVKQD